MEGVLKRVEAFLTGLVPLCQSRSLAVQQSVGMDDPDHGKETEAEIRDLNNDKTGTECLGACEENW